MTVKRRMIALGLSGCMALSLTACGGSDAGDAVKTYESTSDTAEQEEEVQNEETTVTNGQLREMENIVGALTAYMYDNNVSKLTTKKADEDAVAEYLVNYINEMTDDDSRKYKDVLPDDADYDAYYKQDADYINGLLLMGFGSDVSGLIEDSSLVYAIDGAYYVPETQRTDVTVSYAGSSGKKKLTDKKKFTYKYSLIDADGNKQTGKLKVCFTACDESEEDIAVRRIVIKDSKTTNNEPSENENDGKKKDDVSEDGEARQQISMSDAESEVKAQFGTSYDYILDGVERIGGKQYYIYRQTWAEENEDGEAHKKSLQYIYVATDGSTIHTGTADDDGYYIDYSS